MLGAEFKQRRELLQKTQEDCAEQLGRHVDTVRGWENDRAKVPVYAQLWLAQGEDAQRKRFAHQARNR